MWKVNLLRQLKNPKFFEDMALIVAIGIAGLSLQAYALKVMLTMY